ncbi:hypothetical protein Ddc_16621 [Ditylenchus destructor]|nr:hypothetical protein Ddc_16621 [Ditylenchus destructor]
MDNGTMVEAFKHLNYMQLIKSSFVSKRFRNLIRTNRHRLALLYVGSIDMQRAHGSDPASIKMFGKDISPEEYNEWVIRNQYSKQIPLEGQVGGKQSSQCDRKVYALDVVAYYPKRCGFYRMTVFNAQVELNHENWPLFQHFVRLLTDPFIYIRDLGLTSQNDVLNLLTGVISQDRDRLQCKELTFNLEGDIKKFMSWIKKRVRCDKFQIFNRDICSSDSNYDDDLLDFFLTGARCTSKIKMEHYDPPEVILEFVQKFMDLKKCDEYQIVESIEYEIDRNANAIFQYANAIRVLKRDYARFIVPTHIYLPNNDRPSINQAFEFINDDIGKKLHLTALILDTRVWEHNSYINLKVENL